MPDLGAALGRIRRARRRLTASRSLLVAISGIDASGKGWLASRLRDQLESTGARVIEIHADDWLSSRFRIFRASQEPRDFYERAVDVERMLAERVLPLRENRKTCLEASIESMRLRRQPRDETRAEFDIILLEGIFLLKQRWRSVYDLTLWVDCTFETALERALSRRQEHLSAPSTRFAYRNLYFPAQRLHASIDQPRAAASLVVANDPRLAAPAGAPSRRPFGPP